MGKNYLLYTETIRGLSIGSQMPDFSLPDTLRNLIALNSLRGNYVLVDFWASWCGPCRKENPFIVEAYNLYKAKNFTVFSVSFDYPAKKAEWMQAIHKDKLTQWYHVSELTGFKTEIARIANIKSIPVNYLIDPEGKIIASNLRGEELLIKMKEILN